MLFKQTLKAFQTNREMFGGPAKQLNKQFAILLQERKWSLPLKSFLDQSIM